MMKRNISTAGFTGSMSEEIKMLLSFITADMPKILVTDCDLVDKIGEIGDSEIHCTATDCKKIREKNCVPLNPEMPFLPMRKFDAWIVDMDSLPLNPGYVFFLASNTLKMMGVLAVIGDVEDHVALAYGFQILHHGKWHYYLKGAERKGVEDFYDTA